jgi:hypothetical protein
MFWRKRKLRAIRAMASAFTFKHRKATTFKEFLTAKPNRISDPQSKKMEYFSSGFHYYRIM